MMTTVDNDSTSRQDDGSFLWAVAPAVRGQRLHAKSTTVTLQLTWRWSRLQFFFQRNDARSPINKILTWVHSNVNRSVHMYLVWFGIPIGSVSLTFESTFLSKFVLGFVKKNKSKRKKKEKNDSINQTKRFAMHSDAYNSSVLKSPRLCGWNSHPNHKRRLANFVTYI